MNSHLPTCRVLIWSSTKRSIHQDHKRQSLLISDKKSKVNSLTVVECGLRLKYLAETVDRFYICYPKLPWLPSCCSPVLVLVAKVTMDVLNCSMRAHRKNKQSHLACGVLYWYIHSGSDEAPGFVALNYILSSVSGESVDLYIIWTLCYVVTPRLTTLPPVARIEHLLDEQAP